MFEHLLTLENCCQILGRDMATEFPEEWKKLSTPDEIAYRECKLFTEAVNFVDNGGKPWIPNWNDRNEIKYQVYFGVKADAENTSGVGFSGVGDAYACTDALVGARLCFKSRAGLYHAAKIGEASYMRFILIMK